MPETVVGIVTGPELLADLIRRLSEPGARVEYDPETAALVFRMWWNEDVDPPVRIHVDGEALKRHINSDGMRKAAADLWPDVDRETGAMNLLTIHLDETIQTRKPGQTDLALDPVKGIPEWVD